jgi:hypothetical protein
MSSLLLLAFRLLLVFFRRYWRPDVASVPAVVDTLFPPILAALLLLASIDVPALSCVAVGPAIAVVLLYLLLTSAMARVSTVTAVPTASDIVGFPAGYGLLAVANIHATLFPLLLAILLLLSSLLLL